MDPRSTLHWSALLLALFAASWMLLGLIGGLVFVLPLFALAGFILALVSTKRLPEGAQPLVRTGALIGLAVYGLWILLALAALPVSIKNVGTHAPPPLFSALAETLASLLPSLGALAVSITFWHVWARREQVIAGIGTGLIILIQILASTGVAPTGATIGTLLEVGFSLGFLLLLVALVLPVFGTDNTHPAWRDGADTA